MHGDPWLVLCTAVFVTMDWFWILHTHFYCSILCFQVLLQAVSQLCATRRSCWQNWTCNINLSKLPNAKKYQNMFSQSSSPYSMTNISSKLPHFPLEIFNLEVLQLLFPELLIRPTHTACLLLLLLLLAIKNMGFPLSYYLHVSLFWTENTSV